MPPRGGGRGFSMRVTRRGTTAPRNSASHDGDSEREAARVGAAADLKRERAE